MASMIEKFLIRSVATGMFVLVVGCSTNVSRFQMPGTDLSLVRTLYIRPFDGEREPAELRSLIEANLNQRGFQTTASLESAIGKEGGFIFDTATDWHWDLAWYLLELRVAIYDPKDNTLIAQAQSQQSSLARQSIEVIVERAMASLFNNTDELNGEE